MTKVSIKNTGKKLTYTIEIDNQIITRSTTTDYKFAVVSFAKDLNKWTASYSRTYEGAEKISEKDEKMERFTQTKIIELVETKETLGCNHDKSGFPKGSIIACTNCGKVI